MEGQIEPIDYAGLPLLKLISLYKQNIPANASHLKSIQALKTRTKSQNTKVETGSVTFDLVRL